LSGQHREIQRKFGKNSALARTTRKQPAQSRYIAAIQLKAVRIRHEFTSFFPSHFTYFPRAFLRPWSSSARQFGIELDLHFGLF
jgi:hypothetical protein